MTEEEDLQPSVPLLCLDVNLGNGLSPQIIINEGDIVEEVAKRFTQEYGLPEHKKHRLIDAIKV